MNGCKLTITSLSQTRTHTHTHRKSARQLTPSLLIRAGRELKEHLTKMGHCFLSCLKSFSVSATWKELPWHGASRWNKRSDVLLKSDNLDRFSPGLFADVCSRRWSRPNAAGSQDSGGRKTNCFVLIKKSGDVWSFFIVLRVDFMLRLQLFI